MAQKKRSETWPVVNSGSVLAREENSRGEDSVLGQKRREGGGEEPFLVTSVCVLMSVSPPGGRFCARGTIFLFTMRPCPWKCWLTQ